MQKNWRKIFFVGILSATDVKSRILIRIRPLVSCADPDPYQNVTDPQHCSVCWYSTVTLTMFKKYLNW